MPLYEYECDKCHHVFEVMQKFSDEPLSVHEQCGGAVHRRLSAPALQFKGSGWYITDYAKSSGKSDNGKPAPNKDSSSDSSASSSSSSSENSKPASSADKK
jgi:putative FmdB family regulatory protein